MLKLSKNEKEIINFLKKDYSDCEIILPDKIFSDNFLFEILFSFKKVSLYKDVFFKEDNSIINNFIEKYYSDNFLLFKVKEELAIMFEYYEKIGNDYLKDLNKMFMDKNLKSNIVKFAIKIFLQLENLDIKKEYLKVFLKSLNLAKIDIFSDPIYEKINNTKGYMGNYVLIFQEKKQEDLPLFQEESSLIKLVNKINMKVVVIEEKSKNIEVKYLNFDKKNIINEIFNNTVNSEYYIRTYWFNIAKILRNNFNLDLPENNQEAINFIIDLKNNNRKIYSFLISNFELLKQYM